MLRFQTDRWYEALLRPFVLADPNSGVYFELPAPDLRFALLVLVGVVLLLARGRRPSLPPATLRLAASLVVMFIVWTVITGNGRYFIAGLLLTGVLLVAAIVALPGTAMLRGSLLSLAVLLQVLVVQQNFNPGQWTLARWSAAAPGLPVAANAEWPPQPAAFLTVTMISFSILAPQADPRSRWANISGQADLDERLAEYPRLLELLNDPLPKYLVLPTMPERVGPGEQPSPARTVFADQSLARHGLRRQAAPCWVMPSTLTSAAPRANDTVDAPLPLGFWLCPLEAGPVDKSVLPAPPPLMQATVAALERRCPRWFPGGAVTVYRNPALWQMFYPGTDTRLYVEADGDVYVRYLRAINPTRVAATRDVAAGRFTFDCHTIPGRYRFPWERD